MELQKYTWEDCVLKGHMASHTSQMLENLDVCKCSAVINRMLNRAIFWSIKELQAKDKLSNPKTW